MDSSGKYEVNVPIAESNGNTKGRSGSQDGDEEGSKGGRNLCLLGVFVVLALGLIIAVIVIVINSDREINELKDELATAEEKLEQPLLKPTESPVHSNVCLSEGCVQAAARLRIAMDDKIDPCEDFYHFACGSWIKKQLIPEDQGSISTFTVLREEVAATLKALLEQDVHPGELEAIVKAKKFYQSCVNETMIEDAGMAYLYQVTESLGGWPVLMTQPGGSWDTNTYSFENLFLKSYSTAGAGAAILNIGVVIDDKNSTKHSIKISQPALGLPSRDYFLRGRDDPVIIAYRTFLEQSAVLFGADLATATEDAENVADMEIQLANISMTSLALRDTELSYNLVVLGELANKFIGIDWSTIVTGILEGTGLTINMSEPVIAAASPYLEKVGEIIEKYPPRVIMNYVIWRHVTSASIIPLLPQSFRDLLQDLEKVVIGTSTQVARWRQCSDIALNILPDVIGRIFVTESFKPEAKADVLAMSEMFKLAFKEMVDEATWMHEDTKEIAKEKMELMGTVVGYPDTLYNDTYLNAKYEDMITEATSPLELFHSIRKTNLLNRQKKLRIPVDKNEWVTSPAFVTILYMYGNNQIVFPAAVLQAPVYQHDTTGTGTLSVLAPAPSLCYSYCEHSEDSRANQLKHTERMPVPQQNRTYVSYGSLGYLMGIVSMFAYSTTGRNFDQYGQLNPWWTDEDVSNFESRQQCFIDQYNNFTVQGTGGITINGESTLMGNIADNAAMRQAFKGYQVWLSSTGIVEKSLPGVTYTPEQVFFISAAQMMCTSYRKETAIQAIYRGRLSLSPFRVYGPLQNMEEFSTAWNCPVGSFMNPDEKCKIW